jgi:hypothetical protein
VKKPATGGGIFMEVEFFPTNMLKILFLSFLKDDWNKANFVKYPRQKIF